MIDNKISRQLKIALIESDFMLNTLLSSQSKFHTSFFLRTGNTSKADNLLNQIAKAKKSPVFNLPPLLFYSYHYIYDLHSITEILKNFKSTNLISVKEDIETFRKKEEVQKIIKIKNNRIHNKNKDLITMSFANDKFKKRYIFCELPIEFIGQGSLKVNTPNFKLEGDFSQRVSNTNFIRINLRTKEKLEIFSISEFLNQLLAYKQLFDDFYVKILKIEK